MRKALYILGDLDEADIRWMAEAGQQGTVQAGQKLIEAGAPVEWLYIVIDGAFAVTLKDGTPIAKLAAGDILGEMSLVEKRPPTVSVVAEAPSAVLAVPQSAIQDRLAAEPGFAGRFYRALAVFLSDRLRSTVAHLGYGAAEEEDEQAQFEAENELDEGLLDNLHVAGDRLRRLTALLRGAS